MSVGEMTEGINSYDLFDDFYDCVALVRVTFIRSHAVVHIVDDEQLTYILYVKCFVYELKLHAIASISYAPDVNSRCNAFQFPKSKIAPTLYPLMHFKLKIFISLLV